MIERIGRTVFFITQASNHLCSPEYTMIQYIARKKKKTLRVQCRKKWTAERICLPLQSSSTHHCWTTCCGRPVTSYSGEESKVTTKYEYGSRQIIIPCTVHVSLEQNVVVNSQVVLCKGLRSQQAENYSTQKTENCQGGLHWQGVCLWEAGKQELSLHVLHISQLLTRAQWYFRGDVNQV